MIWFDDRFVPASEVSVSYLDRGYCFGDGIYEVFRVYGGHIYEAEAHYDRLERSAGGIRLRLPFGREEISAIVRELIERTKLESGSVYLQITRGVAPRAHGFPSDAHPILMVYGTPSKRPLNAIREGIAAVTREDRRWLHCDLKTLNLLGSVLVKQEALDEGADDAILHRDGFITEASSSNVMIVADGTLWTHPADHLVLHGITRAVVLRLAREAGIPVKEQPFPLNALQNAEELFVTSTLLEIAPVVKLNGQPLGGGRPGPVIRKLQAMFEATIPESERDSKGEDKR